MTSNLFLYIQITLTQSQSIPPDDVTERKSSRRSRHSYFNVKQVRGTFNTTHLNMCGWCRLEVADHQALSFSSFSVFLGRVVSFYGNLSFSRSCSFLRLFWFLFQSIYISVVILVVFPYSCFLSLCDNFVFLWRLFVSFVRFCVSLSSFSVFVVALSSFASL